MKFEIMKTEIGKDAVETVNARDLHSELKSKQDFSTWIKSRIKTGGFLEGEDYTLLHKKMEQVSGRKLLIEYHITLDMAKHLGMMERNPEGKKVRAYFIRAEKQLKREMKKQATLAWQQARANGKIARLEVTDVVQTFIQYAKDQGGTPAGCDRYWENITNMTYRALFIIEKGAKLRGLRDHLESMQLIHLASAETIAQKALADGMNQKLHYKAIFQLAKSRILAFVEHLGKTPALTAA